MTGEGRNTFPWRWKSFGSSWREICVVLKESPCLTPGLDRLAALLTEPPPLVHWRERYRWWQSSLESFKSNIPGHDKAAKRDQAPFNLHFGNILIYNHLVRLGFQLFCYQIISTLGLSIQSLERVKFISSTKHMVALKNAYLLSHNEIAGS